MFCDRSVYNSTDVNRCDCAKDSVKYGSNLLAYFFFYRLPSSIDNCMRLFRLFRLIGHEGMSLWVQGTVVSKGTVDGCTTLIWFLDIL